METQDGRGKMRKRKERVLASLTSLSGWPLWREQVWGNTAGRDIGPLALSIRYLLYWILEQLRVLTNTIRRESVFPQSSPGHLLAKAEEATHDTLPQSSANTYVHWQVSRNTSYIVFCLMRHIPANTLMNEVCFSSKQFLLFLTLWNNRNISFWIMTNSSFSVSDRLWYKKDAVLFLPFDQTFVRKASLRHLIGLHTMPLLRDANFIFKSGR